MIRWESLSKKLRLMSVVSLLILLVLTVKSVEAATQPKAATTVTVSRDVALVSRLQVSTTHENNDANSWNNAGSVSSAKKVLENSVVFQNQHIMGFGAGNPEPYKGHYDWSSLDERVKLMRDTHAQMVITLCGAPGWMRSPGYQDDWKYIEVAPDPKHVQDFAQLAALVAARYPDVKYFQVWNELKGMWSDAPGASASARNQNRWDYERYTTLYNAVYDAVKHVRPDALMGGPYVPMDSDGDRSQMSNPGPSYVWGTIDQRGLDVISYWVAHKHGGDFLTVDGWALNNDKVMKTDAFGMGEKFADINTWIHKQTNLPVWWSEWYVDDPTVSHGTLEYYNALQSVALATMLTSGGSSALLWQPQGDKDGYSFSEGLYTDTTNANGGKATLFASSSQAFKDHFGPGTAIRKVSMSNSNLTVIASSTTMMLINHLAGKQTVIVNGKSFTLGGYQVLVTKAV
jgi:hypothetical protein